MFYPDALIGAPDRLGGDGAGSYSPKKESYPEPRDSENRRKAFPKLERFEI